MFKTGFKTVALAAVVAVMSTASANAATVTSFSSLTVTGGGTDNAANCPFGVGPCLRLSNNDTIKLTDGDNPFSLAGFTYFFSPSANNTGGLVVTSSAGTFTLTDAKGSYTYSTLIGPVTSISFTNTGNGTVRLGELSAVPVPASGLLLVGAIGALAMKRRKKASA